MISINASPVVDMIDYEFLTAESKLEVVVESADGILRTIHIIKSEYEPLGLSFATSLMSPMRTCHNHCIFCFVDQMPKNVRSSLQVKDDDWRLSFIMGNYVTLTNVNDAEFDRMIARRVSPVYVSVHATNPLIRQKMMANKDAGKLLERLTKLKEAGLRFHAQIVLCPGINDGAVLDQTLHDLSALYPAAQSVAIVPVGLTKFRDGLTPLRMFTPTESAGLVAYIEQLQEEYRSKYDTSFVYLSDEWYLKACLPIPETDTYEDYVQIENGVGLLRLFADDFIAALDQHKPLKTPKTISVAGGMAAYPFFRELYKQLLPYHVSTDLFPIENNYFGKSINVAGLITGRDLIAQLKGKIATQTLLIPHNMLREQDDIFLDGITLTEAEKELQIAILPFYDGTDLIEIIFGRNEL